EVIFLQHIAEHLAVAIGQSALYQKLQRQTASLESCVLERTQNLHDALMAAESANLTKGEFLSTMSHELRTPLTYIIGMSATLLRWSFGELSDRQRSYLTTINHSGEQLLTIINDILEFAKIESGRSLLDFGEFSLSRLTDMVVAHYHPLAEKQGVEMSLLFEVQPSADSFSADAKRLEQILSNLVHNAIKFTPAGGKVTLRVWQEAQVTIFQVTDTGIGIPDSQRDQLFEKFKQLESPFQRQYSGTGLGLAMTKRLVELHGGSIQVESTVGKGSTFSVRLPGQAAGLANPRYRVPSTLSANDKRVLLVEREENSAAIVCDLLTADGYEVIWIVETDQLLAQLESL
ncbi:MAG: ATP-binding protein, partial [Cyanobacteria bacterium J06623_5]